MKRHHCVIGSDIAGRHGGIVFEGWNV